MGWFSDNILGQDPNGGGLTGSVQGFVNNPLQSIEKGVGGGANAMMLGIPNNFGVSNTQLGGGMLAGGAALFGAGALGYGPAAGAFGTGAAGAAGATGAATGGAAMAASGGLGQYLPWLQTGLGAYSLFGPNGSATGGGSGAPYYTPQGLGTADAGWLSAYNSMGALANTTQQATQDPYSQSLQQGLGVNYQPFLSGANQAGQAYGNVANLAGTQAGQYGAQANMATGQQGNLYNAANQVYQSGFDPLNQQFQKAQQQLSDQVNAGQAQRGLGTSAVGGAEYNQAMQNFDMAWQQDQLARQSQALQAMSGASNAGVQQGTLAGQNLQNQLLAQGQVPTNLMQAGQVPLTAQQYAAAQPGQLAGQYQQGMAGLQGMYGTTAGAAIPYMNYGAGAQNNQAQYNAQQNQAGMNLLMQGLGGSNPSNPYGGGVLGQFSDPNTQLGWLNNAQNVQTGGMNPNSWYTW